jgi:hypothetical protein
MAQTRKRRRKHAGTQAGTIERRGRTSKPAAGAGGNGGSARSARPNRLDQPPTWKGAAIRAAISALIFTVVVILAFGQAPLQGVLLGLAMFALYVPMSYVIDRFLYNRRQRRLAGASGRRT